MQETHCKWFLNATVTTGSSDLVFGTQKTISSSTSISHTTPQPHSQRGFSPRVGIFPPTSKAKSTELFCTHNAKYMRRFFEELPHLPFVYLHDLTSVSHLGFLPRIPLLFSPPSSLLASLPRPPPSLARLPPSPASLSHIIRIVSSRGLCNRSARVT